MGVREWLSRPAHDHYGPCDGLADGDCSECRRMSWLAMRAEKEIDRLASEYARFLEKFEARGSWIFALQSVIRKRNTEIDFLRKEVSRLREALQKIVDTGAFVPMNSKRPEVVSNVGWARVHKFWKIAKKALEND